MTRKMIITLLALLVISYILPIKPVAAEEGDFNVNAVANGNGDTNDSGGPSGNPGTEKKNEAYSNSANHRYKCLYNASYGSSFSFNISAINKNKNTIVINQDTTTKGNVLSGTWVGINATETASASWDTSNYEYFEITKTITCHYKKAGNPNACLQRGGKSTATDGDCKGLENWCWNVNGSYGSAEYKSKLYCSCQNWCQQRGEPDKFEEYTTEPMPYFEEYECQKTYKDLPLDHQDEPKYNDESTGEIPNCTAEIYKQSRNTAIGMIGNSHNTVSYIDTNDYPSGGEISNYQRKAKVYTTYAYDSEGPSGTVTNLYSHAPEKICINMKTGLVNYDEKCIEQEGNAKLNNIIYNSKEYWHYFIPLNTKTDSTYYLQFEQNGDNSLRYGLCENMMETYSNYKSFIRPLSENSYTGDKETDLETLKKENGCRTSVKIQFNVKQKFYGEKDRKIRGYGSFYRQIDINNPFPNGLSATSIWSGLIDTTNNVIKIKDNNNKIIKQYNLNDSFKEKFYSIEHIYANEIREYNHEQRNFYTSWEDMKVDGTSTFVDKYLTRYNSHDYYKLGCGPANSDWEECKQ